MRSRMRLIAVNARKSQTAKIADQRPRARIKCGAALLLAELILLLATLEAFRFALGQEDLRNSIWLDLLDNFGNCRDEIALDWMGPNHLLEPTYKEHPANS